MKSIITALFLCAAVAASAQVQQGVFIFTETMNIKMKEKPESIDEVSWEKMKERIEKPRSTKRQLLFTGTSSLYRHYEDPNEQAEYSEGGRGGMWKMRFERPDEITYVDVASGQLTEQRDLMGKQFLIKDTIESRAWKVDPTSTKQILGYNCMKATFSDSTTDMVAWWTPQIPVQTGPNAIGQLPGMILRVELAGERMRGGSMVIEATSFSETVDAEEIVPPSKGKKVTQEEYREIQRQKFQEMREMRGGKGGGGFHMRVEGG